MKKWLLILGIIGLSACSSDVSTHYYQLAADPGHQATTNKFTRPLRTLFIEPITVPDYLTGVGIAYQSSDVQYTLATRHIWASPLDQQLQQTLVIHLGRDLPSWYVTTTQPGDDYATLSLMITGFHGRCDGHAVISGTWIYQYQQQKIRQPFSLILPQTKDGYNALVSTLSAGWEQESAQIAALLSQQ